MDTVHYTVEPLRLLRSINLTFRCCHIYRVSHEKYFDQRRMSGINTEKWKLTRKNTCGTLTF